MYRTEAFSKLLYTVHCSEMYGTEQDFDTAFQWQIGNVYGTEAFVTVQKVICHCTQKYFLVTLPMTPIDHA